MEPEMALPEDDISEALSAAVGAHLTQRGDLREEISAASNNQEIQRKSDLRRSFRPNHENLHANNNHHRIFRSPQEEYSRRRLRYFEHDRYTNVMKCAGIDREQLFPANSSNYSRVDERYVSHAQHPPSSQIMHHDYGPPSILRRQVYYDPAAKGKMCSYAECAGSSNPPHSPFYDNCSVPLHENLQYRTDMHTVSRNRNSLHMSRASAENMMLPFGDVSLSRAETQLLWRSTPHEKRARLEICAEMPRSNAALYESVKRKHFKSASREYVLKEDESFDKILQQHKRQQKDVCSATEKTKERKIAHAIRCRMEHANLSSNISKPEPLEKNDDVQALELDGRLIPITDIKQALKNAFQPVVKSNNSSSSLRLPALASSVPMPLLKEKLSNKEDFACHVDSTSFANKNSFLKVNNTVEEFKGSKMDAREIYYSTSINDVSAEVTKSSKHCQSDSLKYAQVPAIQNILDVKRLNNKEEDKSIFENVDKKEDKCEPSDTNEVDKDLSRTFKEDDNTDTSLIKSITGTKNIDLNTMEEDYGLSQVTSETKAEFPEEKQQIKKPNEVGSYDFDDQVIHSDNDDDDDDDDDDEELLKLRLLALSSAYNRNVDIVNECSVGGNSSENEIKAELTLKTKKKRNKQSKEEKKQVGKKDSKSFTDQNLLKARLSKSKPKEKHVPSSRQFSSMSITSVSNSSRLSKNISISPPKNLSDPKILTIGNEVMRKKVKQEKKVLREIRKLNNKDESYNKFMDLINLKNARDEKKRKMHLSNKQAEGNDMGKDNYEEVAMDMVDSDEEQESHISTLPPPPGTEKENETVGGDNQENIWEMLDKPLLNSTQPFLNEKSTTANAMACDVKSTNKSLPFNVSDDKNLDNHNADSPYEFHHAFEPTVVSDPYPAMATDLSYTSANSQPIMEKYATCGKSFINANSIMTSVGDVSASNNTGKEDSTYNTPAKLKPCVSMDDLEELRAQLLLDVAQKRTTIKPSTGKISKSCSVNSASSRNVIAQGIASTRTMEMSSSLSESTLLKTSVSSSTVVDLTEDKALKPMMYSIPLACYKTDVLLKTPSLQETNTCTKMFNTKPNWSIKKLLKTKRQRYHRNKNRRKLLKQFSKFGIKTNLVQRSTLSSMVLSSDETCVPSQANFPYIEPVSSVTDSSTAVSSNSSLNHKLKSHSDPNSNISSTTTNACTTQYQVFRGSNATTSKYHSTLTSDHMLVPSTSQQMNHPPVVINLENSSDEENCYASNFVHYTTNTNHSSVSHTLDSVIKHLRKQSSLNSSTAIEANGGKVPMMASINKLHPGEQSTPCKFSQHRTASLSTDHIESKSDSELGLNSNKLSVASDHINSEVYLISKIAKDEERNKTSMKISGSPSLSQVELEMQGDWKKGLADSQVKLQRVQELLHRDKAVISRMRKCKELKQKEMKTLQQEAKELKNKLIATEGKMEKTQAVLQKIRDNARQAISSMKQRQKLEAKFVCQVEKRKLQFSDISVDDTNLAKNHNQPFKQSSATFESVIQRSPQRALDHCRLSTMLQSDFEANVQNKNSSFETELSHINKELGIKEKLPKKYEYALSRTHSKLDKKKLSKEHLHCEKGKLIAKARALSLQKERTRLRHMEMKLKLIKHSNAKRALKLMKARKSSCHNKVKLQNVSNSYKQNISSRKNTEKESNLIEGENSTSIHSMPSQINQSFTVTTPEKQYEQSVFLASVKGMEDKHIAFVKEPKEFTGKGINDTTSVTPILKRAHSHRRRSSSNVTMLAGTQDFGPVPSYEKSGLLHKPPELSSETVARMRSALSNQFIAKHACNDILEDTSKYTLPSQLFSLPACFSKWKIDALEITQPSNQQANYQEHTSLELHNYCSPLRCFRSYRLSQFFHSEEKLSLISPTFSNKIRNDQILCRYDLTGKCHDTNCQGQHLSTSALTPTEMYLDLLSYCPTLVKSVDGAPITSSDSVDMQLKAAAATVKKLCTSGSRKSTSQTQEETCCSLVKIVNRALGNKDPHTTLVSCREIVLTHEKKEDLIDARPEKVEITPVIADEEENVTGIELKQRYFQDTNKSQSDIESLNLRLSNHPDDEDTRIKLALAYFNKSCQGQGSEREINGKLALHTMCIGIEENDQSEALWSSYIPMLRKFHDGETIDKHDELYVIDQVLVLLPLSKAIWNEVFQWKWSYDKMNFLYQQLLDNLMTRETLWASEDYSSLAVHKHEFGYYSSWLLQIAVERCHLLLVCKGNKEAKINLQALLKELKSLRLKQESTGASISFPLNQADMAKLWLLYIHLVEFGRLPDCLFDDSWSSHLFGMRIGFNEIILPFKSSQKLVQKPEKLRALFEAAIRSCTVSTLDRLSNVIPLLSLYRSLARFEAALGRWKVVSSMCEHLIETFNSHFESTAIPKDVLYETAKNVWIMWTELALQSNKPILVTQIFDMAVTSHPDCAQLAYVAAVYQLNSPSKDEEAALLYLEKCIGAFMDLRSRENLSIVELCEMYKQLLKHDACLKTAAQLQLQDHITMEQIEREKPYLWLSYCLLTDLLNKTEIKTPQKSRQLLNLYEAGINSLSLAEDRKTIWIYYLLYLRSTATTLNDSQKQTSEKQRQQLIWFKKFTSVVCRCLQTVPCRYTQVFELNPSCGESNQHVDYTFHNQVAAIYLSCFSKSDSTFAMSMLTDLMPDNIPLLMKAASNYFQYGDYASISSLLWRMTSFSGIKKKCCDAKIWRMAATVQVADGKHFKALQICQRSLSALPRCRDLWRDTAAFALTCGNRRDLANIDAQCKFNVGEDVESLLKEML